PPGRRAAPQPPRRPRTEGWPSTTLLTPSSSPFGPIALRAHPSLPCPLPRRHRHASGSAARHCPTYRTLPVNRTPADLSIRRRPPPDASVLDLNIVDVEIHVEAGLIAIEPNSIQLHRACGDRAIGATDPSLP